MIKWINDNFFNDYESVGYPLLSRTFRRAGLGGKPAGMGGCILVSFLLILFPFTLSAQTLSFTESERYITLLDRYAILNLDSSITHTQLKSYLRKDAYDVSRSITAPNANQDADILWLQQGLDEYANPRARSNRPILKYFYDSPANMVEVNKPDFMLRLNPILDLKYGSGSLDGERYFLNTRGVEVRGTIDHKVHFYANVLENQGQFGDYIRNFTKKFLALPGEGFVKEFKNESFKVNMGYDWLDATGYIAFNASKHIGISFGHGKNFIGDGYRSMILSDFSDNYLHLKINTRIGKLHYQNIFAELSGNTSRDRRAGTSGQLLDKKYFTAHTLSYNFSRNFNLYLFETVVFGRDEGFELQYLNPIIFFRAVEGGLGSPDNVLLGLGGKLNLYDRFQVYGQFMLDEFKFDEIKAGNGWWANKFGLQLGAKYINVLGIDHLDGQIEFNTARPYMYTHRDSLSSYAHYNQPLAHPLGANFREVILKGRYQLAGKWFFDATLMYANVGEDSADTNFGNNILVSHNTRDAEYGNTILQGVRSDILLGKLDISYMWRHNVFFDLSFIYRDQQSDDPTRNYNSTIINGGFRMNIKKREHIF